ncbi:hypothetical protein L1277_001070 [Okibacterium sp. HSC-33S16]|uniref:HNH endonuclease signature motif containing protein n=1 Tax=Okibacterium sp. HSC-33S16 TaxID=2910965 RepID=UPI0020A22BE8|nr:HNH endonuclease signature motif containing protein [Okibacterium sp. HSC-33S16]MCP2030979.1 hypothetical protein [Okibacterium sp. HSC-33S16]
MSEILDRLPQVVAQLRTGLGLPELPGTGPDSEPSVTDLVEQLGADRIEWFTRTAAEVMKLAEALVAIGAGHIATLSGHELGYAGLAQSRGMRTPEHLVQSLTGTSYRDAAKQVRVGGGIREARFAERARVTADRERVDGNEPEPTPPPEAPWHSPLTLAASAGEISTTAAEAIIRGLGEPDENTSPEALRAAAERLLPFADTTDADELGRLAREERNLLDVAAVATRENALREMRGLRMLRRDSTGMRGVVLRLDPETESIFTTLIDASTGPRRGGPRFVDPVAVEAAEAVIRDPRSTEQIALDTLVRLMELGAGADPDVLFPHQAALRIVVPVESLDGAVSGGPGASTTSGTSTTLGASGISRPDHSPPGPALLEDSHEAVSDATVQRTLCSAELVAVLLTPDNVPFESSISHRLFTRRQRQALAVRDGGCLFPGCDRPVSWTEAHHITPWSVIPRTEVSDGVLLCRHHHMLVHNNGWTIYRRGADYFLSPPAAIDPEQREVLLESKSGLMRARKRARARQLADVAPRQSGAASLAPGSLRGSEPVGHPGDRLDSS